MLGYLNENDFGYFANFEEWRQKLAQVLLIPVPSNSVGLVMINADLVIPKTIRNIVLNQVAALAEKVKMHGSAMIRHLKKELSNWDVKSYINEFDALPFEMQLSIQACFIASAIREIILQEGVATDYDTTQARAAFLNNILPEGQYYAAWKSYASFFRVDFSDFKLEDRAHQVEITRLFRFERALQKIKLLLKPNDSSNRELVYAVASLLDGSGTFSRYPLRKMSDSQEFRRIFLTEIIANPNWYAMSSSLYLPNGDIPPDCILNLRTGKLVLRSDVTLDPTLLLLTQI